MCRVTKQIHGIKKNKLLRYKVIADYYNSLGRDVLEDVPLTKIHSKYIYPKFFISRVTLYEVLNTPIDKQLKEIAAIEASQLNLFA